MNTIRIDYEDGNHVVTDFNGTLAEAEAYYVGQKFQFGDTEDCPEDKLVKAIKVTEVYDEEKTRDEMEAYHLRRSWDGCE